MSHLEAAAPGLPDPCGLICCPHPPPHPQWPSLNLGPRDSQSRSRPHVCRGCNLVSFSSLSLISSPQQVTQVKGLSPFASMRRGEMREERRVMGGGSDMSPRLAPAHTPPTASELCFLVRLLSPAMWGSRDDRGGKNLRMAPCPVRIHAGSWRWCREWREGGEDLEAPWAWSRPSPAPFCPLAALHSQELPQS